MLAAFDRTIGASCHFGYAAKPALKPFAKWQAGMSEYQKAVFDAIEGGNWLLQKISFPVDELKDYTMKRGYKPKTTVTVKTEKMNRVFEMATEDILRMLSVARQFHKKDIRLVQITTIYAGHWYSETNGILLTFEATTGFYVHIKAKEIET